MSPRFLIRFGIKLPEELILDLDNIRRLRNMAAHGRKDPSTDEVIKAIETIEKFEKFLFSLDIENIKKTVEEILAKEQEETENF